MRARANEVGREILRGALRPEPGKRNLIETRREVQRGWLEVTEILAAQGNTELARELIGFVGQMQPPRTDREMIADSLLKHNRDRLAQDRPAR